MTQQEIVNIINSSTVTFHVTWDQIKYDADKAISKINSYLSANYPSMSSILISPNHTYSVLMNGAEVPIFPYAYIHSVVIPFIITEILAREEEFTTIYNKYAMEVEDGLFTMFQREFNRIPKAFRQDPDVGVFFHDEEEHKKFKRKIENNIPIIKFQVNYHINLPNVLYTKRFTFDDTLYDWDDEVTVLPITEEMLIRADGATAYHFLGWTQNPRLNQADIAVDSKFKIKGDVNLYAVWEKASVLAIGNDGAVTVKSEYLPYITSIIIPTSVNGYPVEGIGRYFCTGPANDLPNNITMITLPKTLRFISIYAFSNFKGTVIFPDYDYLYMRPNITISTDAFPLSCTLTDTYIPYSVRTIEQGAFATSANVNFFCEVLKENRPVGWSIDGDGVDNWCKSTDVIHWGETRG